MIGPLRATRHLHWVIVVFVINTLESISLACHFLCLLMRHKFIPPSPPRGPKTSQSCIKNTPSPYRTHPGIIQNTSQNHTKNIPVSNQKQIEIILKNYLNHFKNIAAPYQKHSWFMPKIIPNTSHNLPKNISEQSCSLLCFHRIRL